VRPGTVDSVADLTAAQQAEFDLASEFAQCMREHGLEGSPTLR
jgi:hypothetical protein